MSGFSSFFINPFSRATTTTGVSTHNHNNTHSNSRYFSSSYSSTIDSSTTLGSSVSGSDEESIRDRRRRRRDSGGRRRAGSISSSGSSESEEFSSSEEEEEVERVRSQQQPHARPRTSPATMSTYSQSRPRGVMLNPITPSRPLTATITTQQLPKPTLINRDTASPTSTSNDHNDPASKRPYTPARVSLAKFFYGKLGGVATSPTSPSRGGVTSVSSSGCTTPRNTTSRNGPPPPPITTTTATTEHINARDIITPTPTTLPVSRGISTPNEASDRAHREWMARERRRQEQLRATALQTRLLLEEELKKNGFGAPADEFVVIGRDVKIGSGRYKNGRGKRGGIDVNGGGVAKAPRRSGLEPEEGALLIEEDLTIPDDRSSEGPYAAVRGWVVDTSGHYGEDIHSNGGEGGSGSSNAETLFHPQAPSPIDSPQPEARSATPPPPTTTQPPTTNLPEPVPRPHEPEQLFRALPIEQDSGAPFNFGGDNGFTPVALPFPVQMPVYTGLGLAELPADFPAREFSASDKGKGKDTEPAAPTEKLKDWQLVERVPLSGTPPPQETYPPLPPSTATSATSSGPVRAPTQPIVGQLVRRTTTAETDFRRPLKRTPTFVAAVVAVVEPDVDRLVVEVQAIEVPEEQAKAAAIDPDYYKDSDDEGEGESSGSQVYKPAPLVVEKSKVEEVKGVSVVEVSPEDEEDEEELKLVDARRGSRAPTTWEEAPPVAAAAAAVVPVAVKEEKEDEKVVAEVSEVSEVVAERSLPAQEIERLIVDDVVVKPKVEEEEVKKVEEEVVEVVKIIDEVVAVPEVAVEVVSTPKTETVAEVAPAPKPEPAVEVIAPTPAPEAVVEAVPTPAPTPIVVEVEQKGKQKEAEEEVTAAVVEVEVIPTSVAAAVVEEVAEEKPVVQEEVKVAAPVVAPITAPIAAIETPKVEIAEVTPTAPEPVVAVATPVKDVETAPELSSEPVTERSVTPPQPELEELPLPEKLITPSAPPRLNTPAVGGLDSWDNLVNEILRDRDDEGQVVESRLEVVQEVPLSPVSAAKPHQEERHVEEEMVRILPMEEAAPQPQEEIVTAAQFAELQHQLHQLQQQVQPVYVKPPPPTVPAIPRNLSDEERAPIPGIMVQAPVAPPLSAPHVEIAEEEEQRPVSRARSIISKPSLVDIREEVEQEIATAAVAAREEPMVLLTSSPEPIDDEPVSPPATANPSRNLADESAADDENWVPKYKPNSPGAPATAVEDEAVPAPPPPASPLKEFGPSDKNADNMSTKEKSGMSKRMSRAFSFKGRSQSSNDVDRPGTSASTAVSMRGSMDDRRSIAESTASKRPGLMGRSQTVGAGMMNAMTFGLKSKKDKEKAAAAEGGEGGTSRPVSIRSVKHDDASAPPKRNARDLMKLAIGKKKEEAAAADAAAGVAPPPKKSSMSNAVNLMMLKKKTQDQKIAAAIAAAAAQAPPTASSVLPDATPSASPPTSSPAGEVTAPPTPNPEPTSPPVEDAPAKPKRRNTMNMNNAVNLMMLRKKTQEENKDAEAAPSAPGTPSAEASSAIDTTADDEAARPAPVKRRNTMSMNNAVNLMMFKKGLKDKGTDSEAAGTPPPGTASSEITNTDVSVKKDKPKMGMGMFSRKKSSGTPTSTAPATPSAIPVPVQSSRPPTSSSVMHSSPLASPFNAATSPFPPANSNGTPPGSSPVLEQVATNTDESATDDNTSTATTQVTGNGDASAAPAARPKPPASRRWSAFASATMASSAKSKLGQADDATASRPPSSAGVHPERPALTRPATASSMFGLGGKSSSAAPPPPPPASEDVGAGGSGGLGGNAPMSPEPEVKKKSKMSMGSATKSFMAFGGKKKK